MNDAAVEYPLRPLSIGEIYDRGVTMYARNFVQFTLVALTLMVPVQLANFFLAGGNDQLASWLDAIRRAPPGHFPPPPQAATSLTLVLVALLVFLSPFVGTAVAAGVAQLYRGVRPTFERSMRTVLPRYGVLLLAVLLEIAIVVGLYIAVGFGVLIAAMLVGFAILVVPVFVVVGVILGIAALVALLIAALAISMQFSFALYAVAFENVSVGHAVGTSFSRLFTRREFKKTVLMSGSMAAIQLGVQIAVGVVNVLLIGMFKSTIVSSAFAAFAMAVLLSFSTIVFALYYYDVRTRVEALDLESDLSRLATA